MAPLSRALALSLVAIVVRAAPVKTQAVLKEQEGPPGPDLTALTQELYTFVQAAVLNHHCVRLLNASKV